MSEEKDQEIHNKIIDELIATKAFNVEGSVSIPNEVIALFTAKDKEIENLKIENDILKDPAYCIKCGSCGIEGCCDDEKCFNFEHIKALESKLSRYEKVVIGLAGCNQHEFQSCPCLISAKQALASETSEAEGV